MVSLGAIRASINKSSAAWALTSLKSRGLLKNRYASQVKGLFGVISADCFLQKDPNDRLRFACK